MENKETKPTLEELTSQIEELKLQIRNQEREVREAKLKEERIQSSNEQDIEYVPRKKKKYPSKKDLKEMGLHCKVTPLSAKSLKYLDYESKEIFKATTRPYVLGAMLKILFFLAIAVAVVWYCVAGLTGAKAADTSVGYVVGIILGVLIPSIFMLKSSQILDGYNSVSSSHDSALDWIAWIVDVIALIATMPIRVVSSFFVGSKRKQFADAARVALPIGYGFDDIIEYGMELDSWASLSSTLDRMQNYDKKAEASRQLDEIIKSAERYKVGETSEVQDEYNEVIEEAESLKGKIED